VVPAQTPHGHPLGYRIHAHQCNCRTLLRRLKTGGHHSIESRARGLRLSCPAWSVVLLPQTSSRPLDELRYIPLRQRRPDPPKDPCRGLVPLHNLVISPLTLSPIRADRLNLVNRYRTLVPHPMSQVRNHYRSIPRCPRLLRPIPPWPHLLHPTHPCRLLHLPIPRCPLRPYQSLPPEKGSQQV